MQHFDNLESGRNDYADSSHYREEDFDDYIYYSRDSKKASYEEELKQFYFPYDDYHGEEQELFTTIECVWKVVPPDCSSWDSPEDYYGYCELTAWKVLSVENAQGDEVEPEKVLTAEQLETYNVAMLSFIEE